MQYQKIKYLLAVAAALLVVSAVSTAKEVSYDYVEGRYQDKNFDYEEGYLYLRAKALKASGSFSVTPVFAITADFGSTSLNESSVDATDFSVGVTGHAPITQSSDLFGNISARRMNVRWKGDIEDDDEELNYVHDSRSDIGYRITLGVRTMAANNIELDASISQQDLFDDTVYSFDADAIYHVNEQLSFGVGYAMDDNDNDQTSLFARFALK